MKPITSNQKIEEAFGDFGILCVEDLVAEIYSNGENQSKILDKVSTFKLNKPTEGYGDKLTPKNKGGAWGENKEISNLILSMI